MPDQELVAKLGFSLGKSQFKFGTQIPFQWVFTLNTCCRPKLITAFPVRMRFCFLSEKWMFTGLFHSPAAIDCSNCPEEVLHVSHKSYINSFNLPVVVMRLFVGCVLLVCGVFWLSLFYSLPVGFWKQAVGNCTPPRASATIQLPKIW